MKKYIIIMLAILCLTSCAKRLPDPNYAAMLESYDRIAEAETGRDRAIFTMEVGDQAVTLPPVVNQPVVVPPVIPQPTVIIQEGGD